MERAESPSRSAAGLEAYRMVLPIEVRFADLDGMRHVNNAKFATYLEIGRTIYYRRVMDAPRLDDIDFILARQEIDFLRPIELGDEVRLGIRCTRLGSTSFEFDYLLLAQGVPACRAKSVQVFFDYATGRKKRVPEEFRARSEAFENIVAIERTEK